MKIWNVSEALYSLVENSQEPEEEREWCKQSAFSPPIQISQNCQTTVASTFNARGQPTQFCDFEEKIGPHDAQISPLLLITG